MPCYDSRNDSEYIHALQEKTIKRERESFRHNSDVAQLLCTVLRTMTPEQRKALPRDVKVWWREHRERDAKRGEK